MKKEERTVWEQELVMDSEGYLVPRWMVIEERES